MSDVADAAPGAGAPPAAAIHLGLDGFRLVNAAFGRPAGDAVLGELAARVEAALPAPASVARADGDELVALVPAADAAEASGAARRALAALSAPLSVAGTTIRVTASAGVARPVAAPGEAQRRAAEDAMREAKRRARGDVVVAADDGAAPTGEELAGRLRRSAELHDGIARGELELAYQPILWLATNRPMGVEALVRWQHPEHGLLLPAAFLPVAEETGLVEAIGAWVAEELCRQGRAWRDAGVVPQLHLNASPRELRQPDFAATLLAAAERAGLPAAQLTLELTEAGAMEDLDRTVPMLEGLRAAGLGIAIDDFGAGHSSLARLRELPVDLLKLDRTFLEGVPSNRDAAEVVRAVLALGEALRLDVVAEGIEHERQLEFLVQEGCPLGQGFLLTRPGQARTTAAAIRRGGRARVRAA